MPEAQEALKEDNLMVDLDTSGKAVDVELKEADAKEVDKEQPEVEVKEQPAKEEKKDEREEYSEGVKKRIDRLTYKILESERREKEGWDIQNEKANEDDYFRQSYVGFLSFDIIMTNSQSDFKLLDNRLKSSSFYLEGLKSKRDG